MLEFGELNVLVLNIKSNMTSKHGTNYFIIIRQYKMTRLKLMQIDRSTSKTSPAETHSNNT